MKAKIMNIKMEPKMEEKLEEKLRSNVSENGSRRLQSSVSIENQVYKYTEMQIHQALGVIFYS